MKADILIKNAGIITLDGEAEREIKAGHIAVKGGKILAVGSGPWAGDATRVIDGRGKIVMPGLINAHMHVPMSLLRGYADDYDLQTWLNEYIFPIEAKMDRRAVAAGARLGIAEMIASGTTSFSDMYSECDVIAECVYESGIKANLSRGHLFFGERFDFENDPVSEEMRGLVRDWHMKDAGRIKVEASVHAEYTSSPALWEVLADYAFQNSLGVHLHLSETLFEHEECLKKYAKTPAELFYEAGLFKNRVNAAHCVWISDGDMDILSAVGASVAHNPVSNLKLGSGIARVPLMLQKGVKVALGTDGVSSNDSADLFEEIKLAAILHKGNTLDPKAVTALDALGLACSGGAAAQGRADECGMLKPGMDADLIMIDASRPGLMPCHSLVSAVVYSARGSDVCLNMVRGRILYENGEFTTIDIEKTASEVEDYAMPLLFG